SVFSEIVSSSLRFLLPAFRVMSNRHYFAEEALSVELSNDELRWSSFVPSLDRRFSRRSGRVIGGGPRSVSSRTWLCCSKKMVISTLTLLLPERRVEQANH